jgi:UDP-N-acetyl-2-amino-2-deoxyglucuronate dehydrogenase
MKLRTAILGCGGFAHRHAANLARQAGKFEIVACCDRHPERGQAFADQYTAGQARIFTDHHELFACVEVDLCVVCLPPYGHTDEVEVAAARGVHLLLEKPIALTSEHAWRMVRAAEAAGIKTQVGFMFRFGAAVQRLKELVASGEAGPVGLMSARYFCNDLHAPWWRDRARSGGQLVEQVIHVLDLMRYVMGEPVSVYSLHNNVFHRQLPDYTIEDVSGTVIGFEGGGVGVVYATNGGIPGRWINDYRAVAKNVTADFSDANHATFTFTAGPELQTESIAFEDNYHLEELLDLYGAIAEDRSTRTPIREGALSLDLALAARRSAETGAALVLT